MIIIAVTSTTLDRIINKIGSPYTFRMATETVNDYGDVTNAWTNSIATGYVQVLSDSDESVRAGILNVGDAVGYFKLTADSGSIIVAGSKIEVQHQGTWFQMFGDPIIPHISGNQLLRQINLRRSV